MLYSRYGSVFIVIEFSICFIHYQSFNYPLAATRPVAESRSVAENFYLTMFPKYGFYNLLFVLVRLYVLKVFSSNNSPRHFLCDFITLPTVPIESGLSKSTTNLFIIFDNLLKSNPDKANSNAFPTHRVHYSTIVFKVLNCL